MLETVLKLEILSPVQTHVQMSSQSKARLEYLRFLSRLDVYLFHSELFVRFTFRFYIYFFRDTLIPFLGSLQ